MEYNIGGNNLVSPRREQIAHRILNSQFEAADAHRRSPYPKSVSKDGYQVSNVRRLENLQTLDATRMTFDVEQCDGGNEKD